MMKQFLWFGILLLSASWLFFIPQFTIPDLFLGFLCIILGILCTIGGVWRFVPKQIERRYVALLLIPLSIALIVIPFPYHLGLVILIIGLLISLFSYKLKTTQTISFGLTLAGLILILHTTVFPFYISFVSHGHRVNILLPLVSFIANLFGLHTSTNNGLLFIQTIQQTYPVTITWEKLGLYLSLNIFLAALLLFILLYNKRKVLKNISIFLFTIILYIILRFVAFLYFYLTVGELSIFWNPMYMLLSFLPFMLLLIKLLPLQDSIENTIQTPTFSYTKKNFSALLLMFLFFLSIAGTFLFQDPGSIKNSRVLIDEYHSQWENTIRPLDTQWYGLLSTYNYYSWAQWLGYYYHVEKNINNTLTPSLLADYDILILKCPTESYTTQEIQAIKTFVEKGGGLYLIGDHTNVFGMNTFLNQISEGFGIRYRTDATYELETGDLSTYKSDHLFSHPVMRHVAQFDFMTSCTLEPTSLYASAHMENIIIGNRIISEPGTYSTENFFRESIASPDSEYGYLLQTAAIKYGNGRVVAFTDSTVFSSFCIFTDGYPSFTLGVMEYLNRTNTFSYLNTILFAFSIVFLILLVIFLRNTKKIEVLWMLLFAGLLAFSIVTPLCSYFTDTSYPIPLAHSHYTHIYFEQQYSTFNISVKPTAILSNNKNNYGTFFVWTQRLGCVPSVENTIKDTIKNTDIIVIINPSQSFTESDIHQLTEFYEKGGRILLMDSITNTKSSSNELLGNFGIWITTTTHDQVLYSNVSENDNQKSFGNITSPYLIITGGKQVLTSNTSEVFASVTEFVNTTSGNIGKLMVVVDSYSFSDVVMGGTFTEPTEQQRQIYKTMFFLLDEVLKS